MTILTSLGDRINPILVKEVRQAVRGKFFRIGFLIMLAAAGLVAAITLTSGDTYSSTTQERNGAQFFHYLHTVFATAAFLLVPLQTMRSMSAEKDDNTYDALMISGLRPAQIIQGKWLAAGMLLLLFLSAFAPFLVIGFTLFGLDILVSILMVIFTLVISMTLNLLGLFAACIAKNRAVQTLLLSLVSLIGLGTLILWTALANEVLIEPMNSIPIRELLWTAGAAFLSANLFNLWGYGLTISLIAHPEENGLLRVRWACLLASLFCVVVTTVMWTYSPQLEVIFLMVVLSYMVTMLLNIPIITESNHLGVRCRHQIAKGKWNRRFSWLFLPGGSSAMPLYLLQLLLVSLPLMIPHNPLLGSFGATSGRFSHEGLYAVLSALAVILVVSVIPAGFAASSKTSPFRRNLTRFLIPLIVPMLALISAILEGFTGLDLFDSGLNPFYVVGKNYSKLNAPGSFFAWSVIAGAALFMQLPLVIRYRQNIRSFRKPHPNQFKEEAAD